LPQIVHSGALDGAGVDEHVLAAIVGPKEAGVEPFSLPVFMVGPTYRPRRPPISPALATA